MADRFAVPEDFPAPSPKPYALAGAQSKLAGTMHEGTFYELGMSPPERFDRYAWCEGLARWFATKCANNEHGKYSGLTRGAIVSQYRLRLQGQRAQFGGLSPAEADWVMNECARVWAARSG